MFSIASLCRHATVAAPRRAPGRRAARFTVTASIAVTAIFSAQAQVELARRDLSYDFKMFLANIPALSFLAADFNGDGRPDLLVSSYGLKVLLNEGAGRFGAPIDSGYFACGPVATGDFNGDGKLDIVAVVSGECGGHGHILLGRGEGAFQPARALPPGIFIPVIAADFDGDGRLDIATFGGVFHGNGDGTFRPKAPVPMPTSPVRLAATDLNRDGRTDLIVSDVRNGSRVQGIWALLGNGDTTFGSPLLIRANLDLGLSSPLDAGPPIVIEDFNGDGKPDLATQHGILLGKGDGTFPDEVPYTSDLPAGSLVPFAAMDLDGDGRTDLAVAGSDFGPVAGEIWTYGGTGDGSFLPPVRRTVGYGPSYLAAGDFDGDGRLDIATANIRSNNISLLLSAAASPPSARAVSSASGTALITPDSLATIGISLPGIGARAARPPWPTTLGGIGLEIRDSVGVKRAAPLLYVSSTQINFQVPADVALGEATLYIAGSGADVVGTVEIAAVAPALFLMQDYAMLPVGLNRRVQNDGSVTEQRLVDCTQDGCVSAPVPPSSAAVISYLILYGTGFAGASASQVTCLLRGETLPVEYVGPSGTPGVDQIVVRLPDEESELWGGDLGGSIVLHSGAVASNTVWFFAALPTRCGWAGCQK